MIRYQNAMSTFSEEISIVKCELGEEELVGFVDIPMGYFQEKSLRDIVVKNSGIGNMPELYIKEYEGAKIFSIKESVESLPYGSIFTIFQIPGTNIQYARVSKYANTIKNSVTTIVFVHKINADAFIEHVNKQNDIYTKMSDSIYIKYPPILHDGMLNSCVEDTIGFLKKCSQYKKYGVRLSRGIIFQGKPGNGKTMLCKYIKNLAQENNFSTEDISMSNIEESYGDNSLKGLMSSSNILFFDDVDISFLSRHHGKGVNEKDNKLACSLLSAMDGIENNSVGVVRIFTSNEHIKNIDPAFLRPGRIDRIISFDVPTEKMRKEFVVSCWDKEITSNIDVKHLVHVTEGKSFAEIDEIKSILVKVYMLSNKWNLEESLKLFEDRIPTFTENEYDG